MKPSLNHPEKINYPLIVPVAALPHAQDGLNNKLFSHSSGSQKSETKVWAGLGYLIRLWGESVSHLL